MEIPLLPLTFLVFFFLAFFPNHALSQSRFDVIARSCRVSNVLDIDKHSRLFWELREEMMDEMTRNKFSLKQAGDPPDRLYILFQCMDDLSPAECRSCFRNLDNLLSNCIPFTGGRVYSDGCFIRAENYSFYNETVAPDDSTVLPSFSSLFNPFNPCFSFCTSLLLPFSSNANSELIRSDFSKFRAHSRKIWLLLDECYNFF